MHIGWWGTSRMRGPEKGVLRLHRERRRDTDQYEGDGRGAWRREMWESHLKET